MPFAVILPRSLSAIEKDQWRHFLSAIEKNHVETNLPTRKLILGNCDEKISTILKRALRSRQFRSFGKRRPRCSEVRVRLKRV